MKPYLDVSWNKYKHRCSRIEHVSYHSCIMENYQTRMEYLGKFQLFNPTFNDMKEQLIIAE